MNATSTRKLDRFDRAILRILQRDNRISQRSIAAAVNLSPAAVQRRIAALESDGVIVANMAVVSQEAVGIGITIVVEVHMLNDQSRLVEPMKELLRRTAEVQQCYYVTGNGGFIVIMLVDNMASYEVLARTLFADNEIVHSYRTLVVLDRVKHLPAIVIPDID